MTQQVSDQFILKMFSTSVFFLFLFCPVAVKAFECDFTSFKPDILDTFWMRNCSTFPSCLEKALASLHHLSGRCYQKIWPLLPPGDLAGKQHETPNLLPSVDLPFQNRYIFLVLTRNRQHNISNIFILHQSKCQIIFTSLTDKNNNNVFLISMALLKTKH